MVSENEGNLAPNVVKTTSFAKFCGFIKNLCFPNQRLQSEQEIGHGRRRAALDEQSGKFEPPFVSVG